MLQIFTHMLMNLHSQQIKVSLMNSFQYLIWTASYLSFLQIFRFTAVSRAYLILFTLIVPIFLVLFRNSELISKLLGRNPSKETYISFNLKKDSLFRELRLVSLRKNLQSFENPDQNDFSF